jgi:hypothetical protein
MSSKASKSSTSKKQCEIVPIEDNRMRKAALRQRQPILVKKAMELSILCKCAVRLTIWNEWTNELIHYESAPAAVPSHLVPAAALSNADYASLFDDAVAATPAAAARALDSFVRSPKSSVDVPSVVANTTVATATTATNKKRPRLSESSTGRTDDDAHTGASASDATAPSVKLSRKLHEVIESKSKQQQQQQQQMPQLPRMSPRLRANMPPPFSSVDTSSTAAAAAALGAQPPAMVANNATSLHSFLPPLPMPVSAAGAARNRKKLSVVIPDTPTLHAIPAQHLDASAIASTSLTSQSPAGVAPPLSAFLMPQASARQPRSLGTAPSLDIQMSPLASPNFFDRPSPMTRSALASLLSASSTSTTAGGRSSAPFLPTPSLRNSGGATNSGPFGNLDVFTPK